MWPHNNAAFLGYLGVAHKLFRRPVREERYSGGLGVTTLNFIASLSGTLTAWKYAASDSDEMVQIAVSIRAL